MNLLTSEFLLIWLREDDVLWRVKSPTQTDRGELDIVRNSAFGCAEMTMFRGA